MRRHLISIPAWALAAALSWAGPAGAQQQSVAPGINERFEQGQNYGEFVDQFEREGREIYDKRIAILREVGLKPGMTVADIGAGTGYYTWRIAQRIGATGTVYAVDVQPEMIKALERQMSRRGATNVKAMPGTPADPKLPRNSLDLALMVDVYHEFEQPYEMLAAIVAALKPGGRVAFVEFRGNDPKVPIKPLHTMTEEQVRREAGAHALEWIRTTHDLPWQHVIVFRKQ